MANLSLALAFIMSYLLSPGGRLLNILIGAPVLQQNLPTTLTHLLLAFVNYWIPAVLIFFILRLLKADCWLRPCKAISVLLGLSNLLLILFVSIRIFASTIEGGGASFVVMSFAPFIVWPALAMLVTGLVWLIVRTIQQRSEPTQAKPRKFGLRDWIICTAMLVIPASVVASLLICSAPFRLAREAEKVFQDRCKEAGERIIITPQAQEVQSVYFDQDGGEAFYDIKKGVYSGTSNYISLGESFVNNGLQYFEKQNNQQQLDGSTAKYRKYTLNDNIGEPEDAVTSTYAVYQKSIVSDDVKNRLKVSGTEVSVKNLHSGQVTATLTYFVSQRHRSICGPSSDGNFDTRDFIRRAQNLKEFKMYKPNFKPSNNKSNN